MIGQKLGSFRIEAKIGSGAMGTVYRAVQEPKGRPAAIKVITGDQTQKGNVAGRFRRESDILQQFRHPNIVRFLAVGRSQGVLYFAMEYVHGGTLEQVLEQREYLPWREAVELGLQICEALHYAHQHGIVHRDLKPSNLMITEAGQVKLTDFGIAKDLDATALTATGRTLGTAAYMAPEQIRGTPEVSHRTDLYALGCVLFQMLTGQAPFEGKSAVVLMHNHLTEPPPRPSSKNPDIPLALDKLVVELMAKDPNERPWDAAAVALRLSELKEKADRGEPVAMVFGPRVDAPSRMGAQPTPSEAGAATVAASTAGATAAGRPRKKKKPKRVPTLDEPAGPSLPLGTIGLAAAGVALLALIVYLCLPDSKETLFRKAEAMMASPESTQWRLAKREYIDTLTARYPEFRRAEVDAWLDRIALEKAESRAKYLEHPGMLPSMRPRNEAEEAYFDAFTQSAELARLGREVQAVPRWQEVAAYLSREMAGAADPERKFELRGWARLAEKRAGELEATLARRRKQALSALELADTAESAGRKDEAHRLRREMMAKYAPNPELADLVDRARAGLPAGAEAEAGAGAESDGETKAPPGP